MSEQEEFDIKLPEGSVQDTSSGYQKQQQLQARNRIASMYGEDALDTSPEDAMTQERWGQDVKCPACGMVTYLGRAEEKKHCWGCGAKWPEDLDACVVPRLASTDAAQGGDWRPTHGGWVRTVEGGEEFMDDGEFKHYVNSLTAALAASEQERDKWMAIGLTPHTTPWLQGKLDTATARITALEAALEAAIWSELYEREMIASPLEVLAEWQAFKAEHAEAEHSGDCTNEAHACLRCHVEMVLETAAALTDAGKPEKGGA